MPGSHDEHTFETAVVHDITTGAGWSERPAASVDPDLLLIPEDLEAFLSATQPSSVEQLQQRLGDSWLRKTCETIAAGLKKSGDTLTLLRKGKVVSGVTLKLAYYKPTHGKNPDTIARYEANRLTVVRQVRYSTAHGNTLDVGLFVNGIPVADAELKNGTSQVTDDAVQQYMNDRDPRDVWFRARSIVHFAVDPNTVMMSTAVGKSARFLPFNRGSESSGVAGAGNYSPSDGSHSTSYLWTEIWQRDAWLDLIQSFIHVEDADPDDPLSERTIIFPRYHQWDCVVKYVERARLRGPGHNELAMHSTGSGKTMTQAWLAHRLANLFGDDGAKVFDKVIVLTDRIVLNRNMQRQIEQFESENARGMVVSIKGGGQQLRAALASQNAKIIVTTIQTFPHIVRDVETAGTRFAVIIDEAHSSQSGESSQAMKQALTAVDADDDQAVLAAASEVAGEYEAAEAESDAAADMAELVAAARGQQSSISMFAFTATPKAKTLNQFGELDTAGNRHPTHVYSMRQAIDEGFIMDMLANYTTYKTYYRIATAEGSGVASDEVERSKALAAVRRYAMLHPYNIGQKVQVIVEHFREHVQRRIGGQAKAMIVTASRLHAVRYKKALDVYIASQGYSDLRTLVAFSGEVIDPDDPGDPFTEPSMNGFPETQTEGKFSSDDYQVMVVAEKYQTGFSQPLIHTIYVDKKLSGLTAVQTLSRGNRIHRLKHETFVLDFINDTATVVQAYAQYLGHATAPDAEPQKMYETWEELDDFLVIAQSDIDAFSAAWFDPEFNPSRTDAAQRAKSAAASAAINGALNAAKARFDGLEDDRQDQFRALLTSWVGQYAFLSQMVPWSDAEWEQRYQFARLLCRRIAERRGESMDISDDLRLSHYKMEQTYAGNLSGVAQTASDEGAELPPAFGPTGGSPLTSDEQVSLLDVLDQINERYGLGLDEQHRIFIEQVAVGMANDGDVQRSAANNSADRFVDEYFVSRVESAVLKAVDDNYEVADLIVNKPELRAMLEGALGKIVWRLAREKHASA